MPTESEPEPPESLENLPLSEIHDLLDRARHRMRAAEEEGDAEGKARAARRVNNLVKAERAARGRESAAPAGVEAP